MSRTPLFVLVVAVVLLAAAHAEPNSATRVQEFAKLPNWTGLWETEWSKSTLSLSGRPQGISEGASVAQHVKLLGHPPYNAEWERNYQADVPRAAVAAQAAKYCGTGGFPFAMESPEVFQIVVMPEETLFIFDTGEIRHIYTDGRSHPPGDELWPTRMGDSIGKWAGETLIIDTIARTAGPIFPLFPAAGLSGHAHFMERVRNVNRDSLEDQLTITDSERLTRPWKLTLTYSRVTNLNRVISVDCDKDRNPASNGTLTISPP